ncbi:Yip1 family protein [Caldithrix abyssi]
MDESLNNQNNQQEPMPASEVEPAAPKLSVWQQLVKVFSDPVNFFNHLRSNPTWLFPFLLIVLMSIVFTAATKDQMLEYRKQLILDSDKMTEEMKDMALEQLENMTPTAYYIQSVVGSVIGSAIVFAIAAGLFLLAGNFFLGGKATFKQMFALYVWGNIVSLVEMPVKMILILQKNSAEVYTSLALLMDPQQSDTVLFKLLNAVDIFTIWKIILWSIGFGIIYRFSAKKSYLTVISLYVIYVLISVGLGRLFV